MLSGGRVTICFVSVSGLSEDPRAVALARSLESVGHRVVDIAVGRSSLWRRVWNRLIWGRSWRTRLATRRIRRERPDLLHPTSRATVEIALSAAEALSVPVAGHQTWPTLGHRDYVWVAPRSPESVPQVATGGLPFHTPHDRRSAHTPEPGRHAGRRVGVFHRSWRQSPGEHVTAALERAGVEVVALDHLDWSAVGALDGVFLTESPLPALEVRGHNPGVPVALWIHHGEFHVPANLRLVERYGVHHVLLAHSWHLAHRFPVPVHRFPFAVAPELFPVAPAPPWSDRPVDAALVGVGLRSGGGYERRQEIVASVEAAWPPDRLRFIEGVTREEAIRTYQAAKVVLNDVAIPHYKLTDRVFEATGSGAVLLTDPPPGLDQLFEPGAEYVEMGVSAPEALGRVLADPASEAIAEAGQRRALGWHTYDHRVDDLFGVFALGPTTIPATAPPVSQLARLIADDVDAQRVVVVGGDHLYDELIDRELWPIGRVIDRLRPNGYDAVAVTEDHPALVAALEAARKFVYASGPVSEVVARHAARAWPDAEVRWEGPGMLRVDRWGEAYRMPRGSGAYR